jgi:hypothetical protein
MFVIGNEYKLKIKNGRMFVYQQDTTNLANIYTYEGSELVAAPNPFYVVDGDADNSYVLDNNIYDYVIQEYEGDSTDPSGDLRPEMWHETYAGKLGFKDAPSDADEVVTVKKISGLKNAQPQNYAQVLGYWTPTDCEPRLYMWDANCSDTEDGGLVIKSNLSESGRWILLISGQMKSQYYGVTSLAHQENLRNLLEYPKTIGSFGLITPSDIIMAPCGDTAWTNPGYGFGTDTYNAYGKNIYCQYNAFFRKQCMIRCCSMHGTGVLGNYKVGYSFGGTQESNLCFQPVRMSNFHEMQHWLQCGANTLIQDVKPYDWQFDQYNNQLSGTVTVNNAGIVCEQPFNFTRHPDIYTYLIFDKCNIVGDPKLNGAVIFKDMKITDKWFTSPTYFRYGYDDYYTNNHWNNCSAYDLSSLNNLFYYGRAIGQSAYDCSNTIIDASEYFSFESASNIKIKNYNNAVQNNNGYFILSAKSFDLYNCTFDRNSRFFSKNLTANDCNFIDGSWRPLMEYYPAPIDRRMYGLFNNCVFEHAWHNLVPTTTQYINVQFNNCSTVNCSAILSADGVGWSGDDSQTNIQFNGGDYDSFNRTVVTSNLFVTGMSGLWSRLGTYTINGGKYEAEKHYWTLEPWNDEWCNHFTKPHWSQGASFYEEGSQTFTVTTAYQRDSNGNAHNFKQIAVSLNWTNPPVAEYASTTQRTNLVRY